MDHRGGVADVAVDVKLVVPVVEALHTYLHHMDGFMCTKETERERETDR